LLDDQDSLRYVKNMNAFSSIDCTPELSVALGRRGEELSLELRLASALKLYELGRISSGLASALAGMPRAKFLQVCGQYGVSIFQVTPEDLDRELEIGSRIL
jgi:predicted HTH domain antitoxin